MRLRYLQAHRGSGHVPQALGVCMTIESNIVERAKRAAPKGNAKVTRTASKIRFTAKLSRPKATAKAVSWTFLALPKHASAKLPSRGMTAVQGTLNGLPFRATLEPTGQGGHRTQWARTMRAAGGAGEGVSTGRSPRVPGMAGRSSGFRRPSRAPRSCSHVVESVTPLQRASPVPSPGK